MEMITLLRLQFKALRLRRHHATDALIAQLNRVLALIGRAYCRESMELIHEDECKGYSCRNCGSCTVCKKSAARRGEFEEGVEPATATRPRPARGHGGSGIYLVKPGRSDGLEPQRQPAISLAEGVITMTAECHLYQAALEAYYRSLDEGLIENL